MSGLRPIFSTPRPEPAIDGPETSSSTGNNRDPPRPFCELVGEGMLLRQWLEDADEPNCPIEQSTLTYADLIAVLPDITCSDGGSLIKRELTAMEDHVSAVPDDDDLQTLIQNPTPGTSHGIVISNYDTYGLIWTALIGPGVIMIDLFDRKENSAALHVSEVSQAVYQHFHPLQLLRYIYILNVINDQTISCIKNDLYCADGDAMWPSGWPSGSGLQEWNHGTPQFDALMGTRIGKTVAYILLSAFPRGTRRIGKIATWPCASSAHMRFDLDFSCLLTIRYVCPGA